MIQIIKQEFEIEESLKQRLEFICNLLEETNYSLKSICEELNIKTSSLVTMIFMNFIRFSLAQYQLACET